MKSPIQRVMGAICDGTIDQLIKLFEQHPETQQDDSPLMLKYAAECNRVDVLELLLARGFDVDGPEDDESPLTAAAGDGALDAARCLLDHGADVNKQPTDNFGSTPLHEAITNGHLQMVELLLNRGADPDVLEGNPRRNALAAARFWQQDQIAELLESRGVREIVIEPEAVDIEAESFFQLSKELSVDHWFDKTWHHVYDHVMQHGLVSMCERNQVYFLVGYLIGQLADGGVASVYGNPSGEFTPLMPEALERIGAYKAAGLIRDINAYFPNGQPAVENEARWKQMAEWPPEVEKHGEELESILSENTTGGHCALLSQLHAFYVA